MVKKIIQDKKNILNIKSSFLSFISTIFSFLLQTFTILSEVNCHKMKSGNRKKLWTSSVREEEIVESHQKQKAKKSSVSSDFSMFEPPSHITSQDYLQPSCKQKKNKKKTKNSNYKSLAKKQSKQNRNAYEANIKTKSKTFSSILRPKSQMASKKSQKVKHQIKDMLISSEMKFIQKPPKKERRVNLTKSHINDYSKQKTSTLHQNKVIYDVNSQYEKLIQQYDKSEFKNSIQQQFMQQKQVKKQNRSKLNDQSLKQTKGGLCYSLDVHEFKDSRNKNANKAKKQQKKKKNQQKTNYKQDILKRRQMAFVYGKLIRKRTFGHY